MTQDEIEKLARWANILNGWKWPDDLPGKPLGFDMMPAYLYSGECKISQYAIISPLCALIAVLIGEKEILRWHQVHNLGRTDEEFEVWLYEHPYWSVGLY